MTQARIPDAILAQMPSGAEPARFVATLRSGIAREDLEREWPPDLVAWSLRNGFHAGERVELLPSVVPPQSQPHLRGADPVGRPLGPSLASFIGAILVLTSTVPILLLAVVLVLAPAFKPDLDTGGLGWGLLAFGATLPWSGLAFLTGVLDISPPYAERKLEGVPELALALGLASLLGYALIAHAKRRSP